MEALGRPDGPGKATAVRAGRGTRQRVRTVPGRPHAAYGGEQNRDPTGLAGRQTTWANPGGQKGPSGHGNPRRPDRGDRGGRGHRYLVGPGDRPESGETARADQL